MWLGRRTLIRLRYHTTRIAGRCDWVRNHRQWGRALAIVDWSWDYNLFGIWTNCGCVDRSKSRFSVYRRKWQWDLARTEELTKTYKNDSRKIWMETIYTKTKLNSVAWVRKRTIPTKRPPLVGEVSAKFLQIEGTTWSAWRIPTAIFSAF
jgi:hypothetical protein